MLNTTSHYSLVRGLGAWELVFAGQRAVLRHEQGILYVAYLLYHPPAQPLRAWELAARARAWKPSEQGIAAMSALTAGQAGVLEQNAWVQERSLALDDLPSLRRLWEREQELQRLLESDDQSEPVKAEAARELEELATFQSRYGRRTEDNAQRAVRAVRRALVRFQEHLSAALDEEGRPHPVLRPFAAHLEEHLFWPSMRCSRRKRLGARSEMAGCFTYEPPVGVKWSRG